MLLLDAQLKVVLANRSFYATFNVEPAETLEWMLHELGNGEWNIPGLRELLEHVLPDNDSFSDFEAIHTFPGIGRKVMLLNARKLSRRQDQLNLILLVIQDRTTLYDRERALERMVREKEVLVQEVHHRVKNNLQMIASLLSLHSGYTDNPHVMEALSEAGGRVQAVAQVHEKLYASEDVTQVNVGEYLRNLLAAIQDLQGRPEIAFEIETADIILDTERATPLALIANELILNCFKHAFPAGRAGNVAVSLRYVPDSMPDGPLHKHGFAQLAIQDDGVGFPSGVDAEKTTSMGLDLVRLLSQQLHALHECSTGNGVRWTVTFPIAFWKRKEEAHGESANSGR